MKRTIQTLSICFLTVVHAASAYGIAFCDLRDPTHQIYSLYPDATSYRSLVDEVNEDVKDDVSKALPFTLHNRELGKHTLYLALSEKLPLGLVHVRSEASRWGLIEIVWSLDLELNVRDFRFQRCRDRGCDALQQGQFKEFLKGKSLADLQAEFGAEAELATEIDAVTGPHRELANAVIRSAMKTLLVTDLVWGHEIAAVE